MKTSSVRRNSTEHDDRRSSRNNSVHDDSLKHQSTVNLSSVSPTTIFSSVSKDAAGPSGRCAFVATDGRRCGETWNLEVDHIIPFAKGGDNSPGNLRLLCPAHNRLAAEEAYGRDHTDTILRGNK